LRTPTRKKAQQKIVQQEVKVVDINTTDPLDLQIILLDPSSDVQHHIKLKDDLFAGESRRKLFERQWRNFNCQRVQRIHMRWFHIIGLRRI
jgi:hypothetical protein